MPINGREKGRAGLEVALVFNQSTLTDSYATSPMKLLTPCSRGQSVFTYAANFGGGMVAGDQTRLELRVGQGARCFLGTQASTKIYRNPCFLPCGHTTRATVEAGGLLVFAPAPVQPFADSSYAQNQEFHLGPGAGLVLLDWVTAGRAACGERWAFAHYASRNEIWRNQRVSDNAPLTASPGEIHERNGSSEECVFLDSLCLDSADGPLSSKYRTGRFNCFATLVLVGALLQEAVARLLAETQALPVSRPSSLLISASPIKEGAVLRVAGEALAEIERHLRQYLTPLSGLLGEDPWSRKW